MKKFFRLVFVIFAAFACAPQSAWATAATGDEWVEIYYSPNGGTFADWLGAAFYRYGALWVPAEALRVMGVPVEKASNGKEFLLDVENPADAFDCASLSRLAGDAISLSFPLLDVDGAEYFNMSGMKNLTKLDYKRDGDAVYFTPNDAKKSYERYSVKQPRQKGKLSLVWEHVTKENPDISSLAVKGLDVISPTWFNLSDANGGVSNRASFAYAAAAREKGLRVWALASNGFGADRTSAFFKNARAVNLFMARVLIYAKLYGLDGINVDFEGMRETERENFVRFVSIFADAARNAGLTFSVDVFVPANTKSSRSHDRAALAKYADYIMLMAYDEHWRTCPRAGSVASMPWVARAVEATLAEGVPPEKLVLGTPFYTRRWEETQGPSGVKVKSYTLTMAEAKELAAKRGASVIWLEKEQQRYFSYAENGKTQKVWVEDASSIERKLSLVLKHKLAGMAGWRRGHETADVWDTVSASLGKN